MPTITITIPDDIKEDLKEFSWVNWSEVARKAINKKNIINEILKKLDSDEEKEFINWSVNLGKKAKKESMDKLLKKTR